MPSIEDNFRVWARDYDWKESGDEWSAAWGSSDALWGETLLKRVHNLLPASRLLEIGCGFGRWTARLLAHCDQYTGVDLAPRCVQACRERFRDHPSARFVLTDGRSLSDVGDGTVDFIFSFDSLVHADQETMDHYVAECARVFSSKGRAFLHHSNVAACAQPGTLPHWRDPTVSAEAVARSAERAGLVCPYQELVAWGAVEGPLIDVFTILVRSESPLARARVVVASPDFMREAESARHLAALHELARP